MLQNGIVEDSRQEQKQELYFCDQVKALQILGRKDLPKKKREAIRGLHQLDPRHNIKILFYFGLWGLAGLATLQVAFLPVQILCALVMAFCIIGLPILMHEGNHGLLSKNKTVNRWLGFVCGVPGLVSCAAYRSIHLQHHAQIGSEHDPDSIEHATPKPLPLVVLYLLFLIIGAYLYLLHVAITGLRLAKPRARVRIILEYTLILFLITAAILIFGASVLAKVWLIPLLIAAQISNVRGLAEHGLTTAGNPFTDSRTVISNRFISFMSSNINYHIEHHLFPGVPFYNLPKLHQLLQDEYKRAGASVYRSYTRFLIDFLKVCFSGVVPRVRLIPAHLREDICL